MRPRADEILRSVVQTFDEYVAPEVHDPYAASLALTLSNLMRHVALRIEREGPILHDDNAELREVLREAATYCATAPAEGLAETSSSLCAAADHSRIEPGQYPTLALLIDEASDLRWALQRTIRVLEAQREALAGDEGYENLRTTIRRYLRRSLEREAELIFPAFTGERR